MNNEMTALIENIKADYLNWTTRCTNARGLDALTEINKKMIAEFNEKITYKVGTKYIRYSPKVVAFGVLLSTPITIRSFGRVTF